MTGDAEPPVVITVAAARVTPRLVHDLKRILESHPGTAPVHLVHLRSGPTSVLFDLVPFRVAPGAALFGDLKSLLGPGSVSRP